MNSLQKIIPVAPPKPIRFRSIILFGYMLFFGVGYNCMSTAEITISYTIQLKDNYYTKARTTGPAHQKKSLLVHEIRQVILDVEDDSASENVADDNRSAWHKLRNGEANGAQEIWLKIEKNYNTGGKGGNGKKHAWLYNNLGVAATINNDPTRALTYFSQCLAKSQSGTVNSICERHYRLTATLNSKIHQVVKKK